MGENSPFIGIDAAGLLHPPKAIAAFVQQLTKGVYRPVKGKERRSEPRCALATIVELQPLDDQFQPSGEPFQAVTRDISAGGIGILDVRPIQSKYVALQLTNPDGDKLRVLIEVLRCRQVGNVYDIGGRFVTGPNGVDSGAEVTKVE